MAAQSIAPKPKGPSFRESLYAYGFITPAILAMILASFFPIAFTVFTAFTDWSWNHPALVDGFHFVGLKNFQNIVTNFQSELLGVIIWTLVFATLGTLLNFSLGLVLAFLLNNPNMPERNIYRTVLIVPWAIPGTIMILAWTGLLNTDFGAVNNLLAIVGFGRPDWLGDPNWARTAVILVNAWFGFPFMMTACLGALQSIPAELNEAAEVDGAGLIVRFWRITFPLLRSATLPLIISTFAYNLNNFGAVYLLTGGGPVTNLGNTAGATDILPSYTYKLAVSSQPLYALSAAYSVVIFFFVATLSGIQMKYSRAFEEVQR